jgi:predicted negative regulator of RcsB-dependent stress response
MLQAALGPEHPWVARTMDSLGRVLYDQGDLAGARAHLERALAIAEATVGSEHHWVAGTLDILGQVLRDQGDLAGARACLQRAHKILQAELGPDHVDTQAVARRLESL